MVSLLMIRPPHSLDALCSIFRYYSLFLNLYDHDGYFYPPFWSTHTGISSVSFPFSGTLFHLFRNQYARDGLVVSCSEKTRQRNFFLRI